MLLLYFSTTQYLHKCCLAHVSLICQCTTPKDQSLTVPNCAQTTWPYLDQLNYRTGQHILYIFHHWYQVYSYKHHCYHHIEDCLSTLDDSYKGNNQPHCWSYSNFVDNCCSVVQWHFPGMNTALSHHGKMFHLHQSDHSYKLWKIIFKQLFRTHSKFTAQKIIVQSVFQVQPAVYTACSRSVYYYKMWIFSFIFFSHVIVHHNTKKQEKIKTEPGVKIELVTGHNLDNPHTVKSRPWAMPSAFLFDRPPATSTIIIKLKENRAKRTVDP